MIKKKTPMLDKALQQEEPKIIEVRGQKFFEHKLPNGGTFYDISANMDSGITPTSRPTTQGVYGSGEVIPITYEDILLHRELYLKYM